MSYNSYKTPNNQATILSPTITYSNTFRSPGFVADRGVLFSMLSFPIFLMLKGEGSLSFIGFAIGSSMVRTLLNTLSAPFKTSNHR